MTIKKNIKRFFKYIASLTKCIINDDFPGMASEMAFSLLLALFPFLIFLVSVFGLIGTESHISQIISMMRGIIPSEVIYILESTLKGVIWSSSGELLTVGLIFALIIASNANTVIMKGLNRAYNVVETRPFWYTRWLAILMILINTMVIFAAVNLIIFGKIILHFISGIIHMPYEIFNTVLFVRWPVAFLTLFTMAFLIYYFMPDINVENRPKLISTIPGSLFFTFFWLFASWVFSLYVDNYARFNEVYGAIGAAIVLLLWLYYSSLVVLIGGEINSQYYLRLMGKKEKFCIGDEDL
jgi:membrane protein